MLRLQAFSDAVFAFAATLLVVTLQVPSSYAELLDALAGFPALAIAFAAIMSLWAIHREFFARYPIGDSITMAINAVLLFIVLIYVYPLKLLAELAAHLVLGLGTPTISEMSSTHIRGVYVIFAIAVLATCLAIAALHLRAWQLRAHLELDEQTQTDLTGHGFGYLGIALVAALAIGIAALDVGTEWGLPMWMLLVLSPAAEWITRTQTQRETAEQSTDPAARDAAH